MPSVMLPTKKLPPARKIAEYIVMIFGPPGIGKTTWLIDVDPDVLILSTDRGSRYLTRYAIEIHNWREFREAIKKLEGSQKLQRLYGNIAIDHVDDLYEMCEDYVCSKLGIESLSDAGWGKGWKLVRREFRTALQRILRMGKGVLVVAHETVKKVKFHGLEVDKTMPDLTKTAWKIVVPTCDVVAYAGYRRVRKGKRRIEERILITEPREDLYAKDRTGRCPTTIRLDGSEFITAFNEKGKRNGKTSRKITAGQGRRKGRRAK